MKFTTLLPLALLLTAACAHTPVREPAPGAEPGTTLLLPGVPADAQPQISTETAAEEAVDVSSTTAQPAVTEAEILDIEEGEESEEGQEEVVISSTVPEPPAPVNLGGNGKLTLIRYDTQEKISVTYRLKNGDYDPEALQQINHAMRCSQDGSETAIAVKLVELLDATEDKFGKRGIVLLSGYRTKQYNSTLKGAAEHSMHLLGWAADIRIPGYSATRIKNYVRRREVGGVGYYPYTGFVHMDVGPVRFWAQQRPYRRHARRRTRSKKAVTSHKRTGPAKKAPASGSKNSKSAKTTRTAAASKASKLSKTSRISKTAGYSSSKASKVPRTKKRTKSSVKK